jgi:AcrR family transcriptional regulator
MVAREPGGRTQPRLRELKKQRTRETIVDVAMDLFAARGFQAATLIDIAAAAEIAPSTLYTYFPTKTDIIFSHFAQVLESARHRLLNRPVGESTTQALEDWVTRELPTLARSESDVVDRRRTIIDADEALLAQERLLRATLEDVFAEAFARDLAETADDLRSRVMAAVTVAGLRAVWLWSYRHHPGREFDPQEPYSLDSKYLTKMLTAAEAAIEQIPRPR